MFNWCLKYARFITSESFIGKINMNREQVINTNPDILSGNVVFTGTRVPIQTLIDYLKAGDKLEDFLDGFPSVSREQAQTLLEIAIDSIIAKEQNAHTVG